MPADNTDSTATAPAPEPEAEKSLDPRDLLQKALRLIDADLTALGKKKARTPQEMTSVSRYARDLFAVTRVEESEALATQRELARLSPSELAARLRSEAQGQPEELQTAIAD